MKNTLKMTLFTALLISSALTAMDVDPARPAEGGSVQAPVRAGGAGTTATEENSLLAPQNKEYTLPPEYEALYQSCLENPELFRRKIEEDFALLNPGSRMPYNTSLVIDFALCIKKPEIATAIEDLKIVTVTNGLEIVEKSIDTNPLNIQIMNRGGRIGGSTIWLDPIVSREQIDRYGGDIEKLKDSVRSYMMIPYETLMYAYVFAKAQKREKSFFHAAFPTETHCSGSLVDPVRTWLMAEKGALAMAPEQNIEYKLATIIAELFQSNAFISARIDNIIQRWLSLKIYKRWLAKGAKPMTVEEIESIDVSLDTDGIESDEFIAEISTLMENEAKKRAAELFNSRSSEIHKVSDLFEFMTVDGSINVECSIRPTAPVTESDVTIKSINCRRDDLPGHKQDLKEYLLHKGEKYFLPNR